MSKYDECEVNGYLIPRLPRFDAKGSMHSSMDGHWCHRGYAERKLMEKQKTIEAQAKEIERLEKELASLREEKHDRIQQGWDDYRPSPRTME